MWINYRQKLYQFVAKRISDPATAEDIVHDVLVKAWVHKESLREKGKLLPWLFQITRNAIADYYRSYRPLETLTDIVADEQVETEEEINKELSKCLLPMIADLPEIYRQVILLIEFEGLPQKIVAKRLGLTISGVKTRLKRARELLKKKLWKCCHLEFDSRGSLMNYQKKTQYQGK